MFTQTLRPQTFKEVAGQRLSKKTLRAVIKNKETAPRSLILQGGFGCGKTTMARIFAKALNCPNSTNNEPCNKPNCPICSQDLDNSNYYIEYDSSVVGNVDTIRTLRDTFYYTTQGINRVIVLDECHLASKSAQSALLKVLEDAPKSVFFIFATTDVDKILDTIRSRSLEVRLENVSVNDIVSNLEKVSSDNDISIKDDILKLIAVKSKGHMRNAHMMLDNYLLLGEEDFKESLKSSKQAVLEYLIAVATSNKEALQKALDSIQTYPISIVYEDFNLVLYDIATDIVNPQGNVITKVNKAFGNRIFTFIKSFSSEWVRESFINDISAQTCLLALFQLFSKQQTASSTQRNVRTK